MYKYGVAHCCCGDCSILNAENCGTEADFNNEFELESGTPPVFSSTDATFSGNAKYYVKKRVVKEKLGLWLKPTQLVPTSDLRDNITSVIYYIDIYYGSTSQRPHRWRIVYTAQYPTDGTYQPYKVEIYNLSTKRYETETYVCGNAQDDIVDSFRGLFDFKTWVIHNTDTNQLEFWGHVDSVGMPADYFFYSTPLSAGVTALYKVHWEVIGANWKLSPAYLNMWIPTENEADCPAPSDCSYLLGAINQNYPQLKIWFTGLGDYQPQSWYGDTPTPYRCSLLNNLECYGVTKNRGYNSYTNWWTCCSINFSQTRWITGQLETNPDYDSAKLTEPNATEKYTCTKRNSSQPVLLDLEPLYVGQNQQYENKIDLVVEVVIDKRGYQSSDLMISHDILTGLKFKGTAYKDSLGQLDLNRLNEIELLPELPVPGDYDYDPDSMNFAIFQNAVGHLALSNHTAIQAHNKAVLGTQQGNGEIDYINLTCEIGFIGFTDVTRFPVGYEDFVRYYPPISTILSPRGQNWIDKPSCNFADLNFVSPEISLGNNETIKFGLYLLDGVLWVNSNLWRSQTVPGTSVISPRGAGNLNVTDTMGNCIPIANSNYYIQSTSPTEPGIPETAGKFLNNIDKYGNSTLMCIYPYQGNGTQTWQMVMGQGFFGRAFIPDGGCYPATDEDGYPIYYYGGIPAMIGTISIVYRQ